MTPVDTVTGSRAVTDIQTALTQYPDDRGPFGWVTALAGEMGKVSHLALRAQFANGDCDAYRAEMVRLAAMALAAIECVDRNEGCA